MNMNSKAKKIVVCLIVILSLISIVVIAIMKNKDSKIGGLPTTEVQTTGAPIIDMQVVGKWSTTSIEADYNGAILYSILEFHFNQDGSLVVFRKGYTISTDKDTYIEKVSEYIVANYTSDEIEAMLTETNCTSIFDLAEKNYNDYTSDTDTKVEFMGYWQAKDGKLYNWGQGFTIEDSEAESYSVDGDKMLVGDVEYTRVVYTQGE
jgi:hypothetical protein